MSEETEFFIEFPAGPLAVGNEPVEKLAELQFETGKLLLLSPTDCVKDRLSAFYHRGDRQCLQQAVWVAQMKPIDWIGSDCRGRKGRQKNLLNLGQVFRIVLLLNENLRWVGAGG